MTLRRVVDRGWGLKPHTALPRVQGRGAQRPLEAVGGECSEGWGTTQHPPTGCKAGAPALRLLEPHPAVPPTLLQMLP